MTKLMRALLKQGILTKRVHRIRMLQQTITQGADTPFILLTCDDEPNYDLTTDGSNVAECHPGAKIVAVQLQMSIFSVDDFETIEWVIGRDPDSTVTNASYTISNLYTADVTGTRLLLSKNVWGAGHFVAGAASSEVFNTNLNITKALRRASKMLDGDTIKLVFTMTAAGGNAVMYLRGRIITVGP